MVSKGSKIVDPIWASKEGHQGGLSVITGRNSKEYEKERQEEGFGEKREKRTRQNRFLRHLRGV